MLTAAIMIGVVYFATTRFGEAVGALAFFGMLIVCIVLHGVCESRTTRARNNWIDYWAKGGPDRRR